MTPQDFRLKCRDGDFNTHTSGVCPGYAQANLIVLPKKLAADFEDLCFRNPVPIPLLAKTLGPNKVDDERIISGRDFDIRTDFPKYSVFKKGQFVTYKDDIKQEWTDDHVGFLIGCSYSFEHELARNGLPPKHMTLGKNVPMYRTTKLLDASGVFVNCPYVVSMRPYKPDDIEKVREISGKFTRTHGGPIDWGMDALERLGIKDINTPDYGDEPAFAEGEVPVFWGCGVTPQAAVASIGHQYDDVFMSHAPGHMIILDISEEDVKLL